MQHNQEKKKKTRESWILVGRGGEEEGGTICVKAGALEVPVTLRDALGAEAQGQLSMTNDVVSLQGFVPSTSDSQGGGWIGGSGS